MLKSRAILQMVHTLRRLESMPSKGLDRQKVLRMLKILVALPSGEIEFRKSGEPNGKGIGSRAMTLKGESSIS